MFHHNDVMPSTSAVSMMVLRAAQRRTLAELARVRDLAGIPMMVDESLKEPADLLAGLQLGCIDAINLKVEIGRAHV